MMMIDDALNDDDDKAERMSPTTTWKPRNDDVHQDDDLYILMIIKMMTLGKGAKKRIEKKLTNVSFMYVCVAGNGEILVFFFLFSPNNSLIDNSLSEQRF